MEKSNSNKDIRCTAVLLAAGSGLRMGGPVRKQYIMLDGIPMFVHSVRAMQENAHITDIIVMAAAEDQEVVKDFLSEYGNVDKIRKVAAGGRERFHSVAAGLEAIDWPCDYVFIHDCARPFLDQDTINRLYETVLRTDACVAGVPAKDTIKIVDKDCCVQTTPNRASVWVVQTPQVFARSLVTLAHRKAIRDEDYLAARGIILTDDAMVVEHAGGTSIHMVMSSYRNIKITTPEDLALAQNLIREGRE